MHYSFILFTPIKLCILSFFIMFLFRYDFYRNSHANKKKVFLSLVL